MQNATMIRRGAAVAAVVGALVIVLVLVISQGKYDVKVLKTISAGNVQPPVTPFK